MIVYKITNLVTNKIYIGQTIQPLYKRWAQHKSARRTCPLNSSIKKHGAENFKIEVIATALSLKYLDCLEIELIAQYDCMYPKGYNLATGGSIAKARIGVASWNKGLKATDQAKSNQSIAHLGQKAWNKGLKASLAAVKKMSKAKLGKHISPATEFKPGAQSAFKGKKHSIESLALISKNNASSRKVRCITTRVVYASILEASKSCGIDKTTLREIALNGKTHRKTGLTFKFID